MIWIHVVHYGRVLCGWTDVFPGHWPDGQRWCAFDDLDRARGLCELDPSYQMCVPCLARAGARAHQREPS